MAWESGRAGAAHGSASLLRVMFDGAWGRRAHVGNPRGRHVLGIAAVACGALALAGALAISWFLSSGLGWYGPRESGEVGAWFFVQWSAFYGAWICAGTSVAGLACAVASLFARWSLGLTLLGLLLSAGALTATLQTYGLFFWNQL